MVLTQSDGSYGYGFNRNHRESSFGYSITDHTQTKRTVPLVSIEISGDNQKDYGNYSHSLLYYGGRLITAQKSKNHSDIYFVEVTPIKSRIRK